MMSQLLSSPLISLYATFLWSTFCPCFAFALNSTFQNAWLSLCITSFGKMCLLLALMSDPSDSSLGSM